MGLNVNNIGFNGNLFVLFKFFYKVVKYKIYNIIIIIFFFKLVPPYVLWNF